MEPRPVEIVDTFDADPTAFVDDVLYERVYLGRQNLLDLPTVFRELVASDEDERQATLDAAFAGWIEDNWERSERGARATADAWISATDVVAFGPELPQAARKLRAQLGAAEDFLRPLTAGDSRDPLAHYLQAVAETQRPEERDLLPTWWSLIHLNPPTPYYHGRIGLLGVRRLTPADPEETGRFRTDVAHAMLALVSALDREAQRSPQMAADLEGQIALVVAATVTAFPFSGRWQEFLESEIGGLRVRAREIALQNAGVDIDVHLQPRPRARARRRSIRDPEWTARGDALAARIERRNLRLPTHEIEAMLEEGRRYAELRGEAWRLGGLLRKLTHAIQKRGDAEQAVQWAHEARLWEPYDPYSWSTLGNAFRAASRLSEAAQTFAEGVDRFPESPVLLTDFAAVLHRSARYLEAEEAYREVSERFPNWSMGWTGLASVLVDEGKADDAERVARTFFEQAPEDSYAWSALVASLRHAGRFEEALTVAYDYRSRFGDEAYSWAAVGETLAYSGRRDEARASTSRRSSAFPTTRSSPASFAD